MQSEMSPEKLERIAISSGADLVGFADLSTQMARLSDYGYDMDKRLPFAM